MENSTKKKWFVILNPHAGSGRGKKDQEMLVNLLTKKGFHFKLAISEFPKHTIQLTVQAIEKGYRELIVAGGDGTLNEVVNGIYLQSSCSPAEITVGVIPVGTGNDWIKTFGVPNHYKEAIKILNRGKTIQQDIGRVIYSENGQSKTCYFANMAGFGFDAMVAQKTNQMKDKGRKGISLYLQALGVSFFKYKTFRTKIVIDDQEINDFIFLASIGIGKFNGGGMMLAPDADPTNGIFQVTVIRKVGLFAVLRNLAGLYNGTFVKDPRVSIHEARRVSISSEKNISGEADGEILGDNKFEIDMVSQKLSVIFNPEKYLKFTERN